MTLQPPLNAVLSVLFMGRTMFSGGEVVGGAFIVAGLLVATFSTSDAALLAPNYDGKGLLVRSVPSHFSRAKNGSDGVDESKGPEPEERGVEMKEGSLDLTDMCESNQLESQSGQLQTSIQQRDDAEGEEARSDEGLLDEGSNSK